MKMHVYGAGSPNQMAICFTKSWRKIFLNLSVC